ncbi:hypothetical protein B0H14DRAFT_2622323 [Mycena olivaceomarginata]|nr:hypothetical protein B0H14DRAFT_2622323 [Mycena olivaceomarginata]
MDRQRSAWSAYTYAYWDPADLCLRGGLNAGYHPQRQAYPYIGGHSDVPPGVYSAGNSGYSPNYGQMSYNGDAAMLKYGWPEGQGSRWGESHPYPKQQQLDQRPEQSITPNFNALDAALGLPTA